MVEIDENQVILTAYVATGALAELLESAMALEHLVLKPHPPFYIEFPLDVAPRLGIAEL